MPNPDASAVCISEFGHVYSDDGCCRRCGTARPGERCEICRQGFADDPENKHRHATGELVHMTCYDRMWEQ